MQGFFGDRNLFSARTGEVIYLRTDSAFFNAVGLFDFLITISNFQKVISKDIK